ncbi:hypothetical protein BX265_6890 [Streptomyces sp. TLI_235]|nr:hypothetical protein BX265_6890 [Streptomyces sp. TLI_235]
MKDENPARYYPESVPCKAQKLIPWALSEISGPCYASPSVKRPVIEGAVSIPAAPLPASQPEFIIAE